MALLGQNEPLQQPVLLSDTRRQSLLRSHDIFLDFLQFLRLLLPGGLSAPHVLRLGSDLLDGRHFAVIKLVSAYSIIQPVDVPIDGQVEELGGDDGRVDPGLLQLLLVLLLPLYHPKHPSRLICISSILSLGEEKILLGNVHEVIYLEAFLYGLLLHGVESFMKL